jgi:hypothetical protein
MAPAGLGEVLLMTERRLHYLGFFGSLILWSGPVLWLWFGAVDANAAMTLSSVGLAIIAGAAGRLHKIRRQVAARSPELVRPPGASASPRDPSARLHQSLNRRFL